MTESTVRAGIRYEIPAPNPEEGKLAHLDGLIGFLKQVDDTARLRAKQEKNIQFLHARTGTPVGKLWKLLTIWTPEAVSQRVRAKNLIKAAIEGVESTNLHLRNLEKEIINVTLKISLFREFDTRRLEAQLSALKKLAEKPEQEANSHQPVD